MGLVELEIELRKTIKEIEADDRFHYKKATIFENAPLALIQLEMETRIGYAKKYLKLLKS